MGKNTIIDAIENRLREEAAHHARRAWLPTLLSPIPASSDDSGRLKLRAAVEKGLRRERMKARSGHAGYDFNRHLRLLQLRQWLWPESASDGRDAQTAHARESVTPRQGKQKAGLASRL